LAHNNPRFQRSNKKKQNKIKNSVQSRAVLCMYFTRVTANTVFFSPGSNTRCSG
jgi:hypothetical protein